MHNLNFLPWILALTFQEANSFISEEGWFMNVPPRNDSATSSSQDLQVPSGSWHRIQPAVQDEPFHLDYVWMVPKLLVNEPTKLKLNI